MLSGLHLFGQKEVAGLGNLKSILKSEVAEAFLSFFFKCMFKKMCFVHENIIQAQNVCGISVLVFHRTYRVQFCFSTTCHKKQ